MHRVCNAYPHAANQSTRKVFAKPAGFVAPVHFVKRNKTLSANVNAK
jgi:hypothetical protein